MSKVVDALQVEVRAGEAIRRSFTGLSDGLNRSSRQPLDGAIGITDSGVLVAWIKAGLIKKTITHRFTWQEILDVTESDDSLPGLAGAIERKNASKMLGRAMGSSNTRPTVTIKTRSGDYSLFFKNKERGLARDAFVSVMDGLGRRS